MQILPVAGQGLGRNHGRHYPSTTFIENSQSIEWYQHILYIRPIVELMIVSASFNCLRIFSICSRYPNVWFPYFDESLVTSVVNATKCINHFSPELVFIIITIQELRKKWHDSTVNVPELRRILDHDNIAMRNELRRLLQSDPVFIR